MNPGVGEIRFYFAAHAPVEWRVRPEHRGRPPPRCRFQNLKRHTVPLEGKTFWNSLPQQDDVQPQVRSFFKLREQHDLPRGRMASRQMAQRFPHLAQPFNREIGNPSDNQRLFQGGQDGGVVLQRKV